MGKEKRKSRSEVIFDLDDFKILFYLEGMDGEKYGIESISKVMDLSHKGILVHLKRMMNHNLIEINRSKKDHKTKVVRITKEGKTILNEFWKSPHINQMMGEEVMDYKFNNLLKKTKSNRS